MKGRRARIFHLTRDVRFIRRVVAAIIGLCFVIAYAASKAPKHALPADAFTNPEAMLSHVTKTWLDQVRETYLLLRASSNTPDSVASWLRDIASERDEAARDWPFDPAQLRLQEYDLNNLLHKHVPDPASRDVFADFARALLIKDAETRSQAAIRIQEAGRQKDFPRYANEFAGDLAAGRADAAEALAAYLKEGAFPDAKRARRLAWSLAEARHDVAALKSMLQDARFRRDASAHQLVVAARLAGDPWLMARAFIAMEFGEWMHWEALLALFAVGIWYVIVVYGGSNDQWRWLTMLPPLAAGVVSTWIIDLSFQFFEYGHASEENMTPVQSILHYVVYVGLTEETAKLILFAPFLFWLLKRKVRSHAALTAGCVGLGFAAAENIQYYMREGATNALGRMVTANFFHMALTGILGVALYDWLRVRCHRTEQFMGVYAGVVVAHGMYDFCCGEQANEMGIGMMRIIIFALSAQYYFHVWQPELQHKPRHTVSITSVFCFGCALLIGVVMIVAGQSGDRRDIYASLGIAVSLAPVAWIFVREFRGA